MSNKPTLDEILEEVFIFGGASYADDIPANEREKVHENFRLYAKNQAKQQLSQLIDSIIGEDELEREIVAKFIKRRLHDGKPYADVAIENKLRLAQRQRAKERGIDL